MSSTRRSRLRPRASSSSSGRPRCPTPSCGRPRPRRGSPRHRRYPPLPWVLKRRPDPPSRDAPGRGSFVGGVGHEGKILGQVSHVGESGEHLVCLGVDFLTPLVLLHALSVSRRSAHPSGGLDLPAIGFPSGA